MRKNALRSSLGADAKRFASGGKQKKKRKKSTEREKERERERERERVLLQSSISRIKCRERADICSSSLLRILFVIVLKSSEAKVPYMVTLDHLYRSHACKQIRWIPTARHVIRNITVRSFFVVMRS